MSDEALRTDVSCSNTRQRQGGNERKEASWTTDGAVSLKRTRQLTALSQKSRRVHTTKETVPAVISAKAIDVMAGVMKNALNGKYAIMSSIHAAFTDQADKHEKMCVRECIRKTASFLRNALMSYRSKTNETNELFQQATPHTIRNRRNQAVDSILQYKITHEVLRTPLIQAL